MKLDKICPTREIHFTRNRQGRTMNYGLSRIKNADSRSENRMEPNKFKIQKTGSLVRNAGLDPRVERVLIGLGMQTVPQLYSAMKASPTAFEELLKDYSLTYKEVMDLLEPELTQADKDRMAEVDMSERAMGFMMSQPPSALPNVIQRNPEDK